MHLNKDLREFIELLNTNGVEYIVVGAFAVAWHGYPRFTSDIDFLIRPDLANASLMKSALTEFGFGSLDITIEDLTRPDFVIQLGVVPNRIDIITAIAGISIDQAWESRVAGKIDDIPVYFLGRDALIRNKDAAGRSKDQIDAIELRKRDPNRKR